MKIIIPHVVFPLQKVTLVLSNRGPVVISLACHSDGRGSNPQAGG